jgi:hypothetical protein
MSTMTRPRWSPSLTGSGRDFAAMPPASAVTAGIALGTPGDGWAVFAQGASAGPPAHRALAAAITGLLACAAAPDALTALCRLLATLHDKQGNVAVSGLLTAGPPTAGYPEYRSRAEAALLDGVHLVGTGSVAERVWTKPAATVLAIDAPPVASASNAHAPVARAKVSLRLAPGDDAIRRAGCWHGICEITHCGECG